MQRDVTIRKRHQIGHLLAAHIVSDKRAAHRAKLLLQILPQFRRIANQIQMVGLDDKQWARLRSSKGSLKRVDKTKWIFAGSHRGRAKGKEENELIFGQTK